MAPLELALLLLGTGLGSGLQVLSHGAFGLRGGSTPLARYLAMVLSTHRSPDSESACVVPPGSASSTEFGNSLRTSRLPSNGVAASSVSSISSAFLIPLPLICIGVCREAGAGQRRHGALNQALSQVSNGAILLIRSLSRRHTAQLVGHCTSVHCTAL